MESNPQFLTGASITNLLSLIIHHGIERRFWLRAVEAIACSLLLTPFYFFESLYVKIVPRPSMHPAPVFVIGHWRSGTTYLHYLMSKDKQFGYCSNTDAFTPGALFVGRWLFRKIIALRLPPTRPMDKVKLSADSPQEEEFAIMLLSKYSCYHAFVFPSEMRDLFKRCNLIETDNVSEINAWKDVYFKFIQKISKRNKNKQLLLKNPANTSRIKHLVSMFPKAKFIYLYRDAIEVKLSTTRLLDTLLRTNSLQAFDHIHLDAEAAYIHEAVIKSYEQQRVFLEPDNLIEVRYKDLVADPLATVRRIYTELNLSEFHSSEAAFRKFINEQKDYQQHVYEFHDKSK